MILPRIDNEKGMRAGIQTAVSNCGELGDQILETFFVQYRNT